MNVPRSLLPALALPFALSACVFPTETVYVERDPAEPVSDSVAVPRRSIDTDAILTEIYPGYDTGLYIEYESGGLWYLYTTCSDVAVYGDCHWDVITTVNGGDFIGTTGDDLESSDLLTFDDFGPRYDVYTGEDFDGVFIQTTPGASLEVDVLLDDDYAWDEVFWVSDGVAVIGPPSNPFELVPTEP
jgi:hypothetical protein